MQDAIRNGFHDVADELEAHGARVSPDVLAKFVREAVEAGNVQVTKRPSPPPSPPPLTTVQLQGAS